MNFRRSIIIAELWRPEVARCGKMSIFSFFKRPHMGKFLKFCSERIRRDTDRRLVFKFREIWPSRNR